MVQNCIIRQYYLWPKRGYVFFCSVAPLYLFTNLSLLTLILCVIFRVTTWLSDWDVKMSSTGVRSQSCLFYVTYVYNLLLVLCLNYSFLWCIFSCVLIILLHVSIAILKMYITVMLSIWSKLKWYYIYIFNPSLLEISRKYQLIFFALNWFSFESRLIVIYVLNHVSVYSLSKNSIFQFFILKFRLN